MEFLLVHGAGADSDSESIRSDISESFIGSLFQRRPGSGRRKKQVPWRSPWDASVSTDYHIHYIPKEILPSRLGLVNNNSIPSSPSIQAQRPAPTPSSAATPTNSSKRKTKQDLAGPCCHCNAVSSPQWRKGPKGKPILCNACGIRFLRTRTLGKAMPKKRRVAVGGGSVADAVNNQPKRMKGEEPATEDEELELAADEGAGTEDVVATDDGLEEAHSPLAGITTQLEHPHAAHLPQSRLAIASSAMDGMHTSTTAFDAAADMRTSLDAAHTSINVAGGDMRSSVGAMRHSVDAMAGQLYTDEGSADQESEEQEQASSLAHMSSDAAILLAAARSAAAGTSSSSGCYSQTKFLNLAAAGTHQPLAAGSRHVLLGSSSRLSHSPVLSLALALHQQQQQQYSNCSSMQQPGSPAKADTATFSAATGSPMSNASNFHFRSLDHSDYAASGSTPGSPMLMGSSSSGQIAFSSGVSSMLSAQQQQPVYPQLQQQMSYTQQQFHHHMPQQLQQQYVQHSLHGPSPLGQQQQYTEAHAELATAVSASQPVPAVQPMQSLPAAAAAANGDVIQLVRQMASALGGMGPAFDLLSTINANRQAAATAAAANCSHV